jgi:CheY-like chemotaxis protein
MASAQQAPTIMIIEDEFVIRETLTEFLEDEGYTVAGAGNGEEALEHLQHGALPSLILLDLMMPVMSGPQLLAELQRDARFATIPVVLLTADRNVNAQHMAEPVVECLEKPIHLKGLLEIVDRYCGQPIS